MRGIVIKPDGVVPFEAGLADHHRKLMLADLADMGHTIQHVAGPHPVHGGVSHAILLSGPHSADGQARARADAASGKLDL